MLRHTRKGDKYVTRWSSIKRRFATGPARHAYRTCSQADRKRSLKLGSQPVPGKGMTAATSWQWTKYTGFKTATAEEPPDAVPIVDPLHVIRLAGEVLGNCRHQIRLDAFSRHRRKDDPLYRLRRTLITDAGLLTEKQRARLGTFPTDDRRVQEEAPWRV